MPAAQARQTQIRSKAFFSPFCFSLKIWRTIKDQSHLRGHGGSLQPPGSSAQGWMPVEKRCFSHVWVFAIANTFFSCFAMSPLSSCLPSLWFLSTAGNEGVEIPFPFLLCFVPSHTHVPDPHPETGGTSGGTGAKGRDLFTML